MFQRRNCFFKVIAAFQLGLSSPIVFTTLQLHTGSDWRSENIRMNPPVDQRRFAQMWWIGKSGLDVGKFRAVKVQVFIPIQ